METYIRHPFSENDINTILFWHEDLHFSAELIVYLVEYCVSKGHTNLRYLNKVALAWHEKKITSVEQAKSEAAVRSKAYYAVMKAFGITGRNLIDSETAMIRKWTKEYAFDLSLIQEACARTISSTGQSSFSYADSILTSWYNDKVHSLEDVKRLDATHQQKKKERAAVKANAAASPKKQFIIATEIETIHKLQKDNPDKEFIPIHPKTICGQMKKVTLENVLEALEKEQYVVKVPEDIRQRAWLPIERMLKIH